MQRLFLLILLAGTQLLPLNAQFCNDTRFTASDHFTDAQLISEFNVPYGLAENWFMDYPQPILNAFDISYPDPALDPMEKRPLVLLTHGGGFWGGEKESLSYYVNELAKSGYVTVAMNYRKGWLGSPIDCAGDPESLETAIYRAMQDVHACLCYLVEHADEYGIDTSRIYAGGESAGAYAVMNSIYMSQAEWDSAHPGLSITNGPIAGSTNDLDNSFTISGIINMWGGLEDTTFVALSEAISTISFLGNLDDVVPPYEGHIQMCPEYAHVFGGEGIAEYLGNKGVCNELHVNPLQGHEAYDPTYTAGHIACFIKSLLCNSCSSAEYNFADADCADDYAVTTGIAGGQEISLSIFPNPASERVHVQLPADWQPISTLRITDVAGRNVSAEWGVSGTIAYAYISDLAPGIYQVTCSDGTHTSSGRFVVSK